MSLWQGLRLEELCGDPEEDIVTVVNDLGAKCSQSELERAATSTDQSPMSGKGTLP